MTKHRTWPRGFRISLVAALPLLWLLIAATPTKPTKSTSPKARKGAQTKATPKIDPFSGLPPMKATGKEVFFRFRPGPKPPGKIGKHLSLPFPPPASLKRGKAPTLKRRPLKVIHVRPKGKVSLIGAVTVTFNQPMIPLSSVGETRLQTPPFRISPQPKGRFRWLGTRTVGFEPKGRMPYSTKYRVTIPKGIASTEGSKLLKTVTYEFVTPRLQLVRRYPSSSSYYPERPDTWVAMLFNQKISPKAIMKKLRFRGPKGRIRYEWVPPSQWSTHKRLYPRFRSWKKSRTLILRPLKELPKASRFSVKIFPGVRGEGPLETLKPLRMTFHTYGPMQVVNGRCSWYKRYMFGLIRRCNPRSSIYLRFSNSIGNAKVDKWIVTEPKLKGVNIRASGRYVYISRVGGWPASSRLTVRVLPGLKDIYGQKLTKSFTFRALFSKASPFLRMPRYNYATLELHEKHTFTIRMRNIFDLRTRMVRIQPSQIPRFRKLIAGLSYRKYKTQDPLAGMKLAYDKSGHTGMKLNKEGKRLISLGKVLKGRPGHVAVVFSTPQIETRWRSPHIGIVLQVTDIGISVRHDYARMAVLATSFKKNKPLRNAKVFLRHYNRSQAILWRGKTNARGYVEVPGPMRLKQKGPFLLQVKQGRDTANVHLNGGGTGGYTYGYSHYSRIPAKLANAYFMFTERAPYKPGETVHIRGVLRRRVQRPKGGIVGLPDAKGSIHYTIRSPRYQIVKKGKARLLAGLSFNVDFTLKELADLGHYRVQGYAKLGTLRIPFYHSFQVQAYRAPEYKVKVKAGPGPFFVKQKIEASVSGRYTFGAPMIGARVSWILRRSQGSYRPPNQPQGFRFGRRSAYYSPWRYRYGYRGRRYGGYYRYRRYSGTLIARGKGKLDAKGLLKVKLHLDPAKHKGPTNFRLEAQVFDKNRQSIAGRKTILAHTSSRYVGIRSNKPIIKAKKKAFIEAVVADIQGQRLAGVPIVLKVLMQKTTRKAVKRHGAWSFVYKSKEVKVGGCRIQSGKDIVRCAIRVPKAGYYTIQAEVKDRKGRKNVTRMGIYAYGKSYIPWKTNRPENLELIADKKSYKPGDVARILVKSPFRKAHGILTLERNGIAEHKPLLLKGSANAIKVKIRREYLPNLWVAVSLSRGRVPLSKLGIKGASGADDLGRPMYAFGKVNLAVSLTEKQIRVQVKPKVETLRPGKSTEITLKTTDHKGKGVRSVVTVALVDEGVLSLLGFRTPAPLRAFHTSRPSWAVLRDLRLSLLERKKSELRKKARLYKNKPRDQSRRITLSRPGKLRAKKAAGFSMAGGTVATKAQVAPAAPPRQTRSADDKAPTAGNRRGLGGQQGQSRGPAIRVRSKFATTAFYRAIVKTDKAGIARFRVKMPDNLTTFRIMAVALDAVQPDRFGHGESRVTIRKPLLLRPALPRFANYGDTFEAAVVINNETGKSGKVQVFARGINIRFTGNTRTEITIPAGEAREVRFPVAVAKTGIARFQFAAVMGKESDAVEHKIPVLVPATAEAFATYGTTKGSVAQPISPPKDALSPFGGLKISLSSTALTGLEDAVRYLVSYPFTCTEQTASRAMPIFALRKILPAFKIGKVSDQAKMKRLATAAVQKLLRLQRYDGGWGYWSGSRYSYMWVSGYVTYALLRAKAAGYKVPASTFTKASRFLRNRLRWSPFIWERNNPTLRTMATWVLSELKPNVTSYLNELYGKRKQLALFAKAWLMVAIHRHDKADARIANLLRLLNNAATQLPGRVHFAEKKTESLRMLMHSEDRSDAIILQALLEVRPKHALIPKVVRGLMRSRIRGRWSTTQSNAFAMLALSKYFSIYEKVVPNFSVQNWLGKGFLGQAKMKGRSMTVVDQKIPMRFLKKQGKQKLILYKRGKGRLYYRIGLRYAPKDFKLPPEEQGFALSRIYESVSKKGDVTRLKDGTWRFKAGAYVRVRLRIIATGYRYFTAVVDPLPAGLEAVNLAFKTSASSALRSHQTRSFYHSYSWYSFFAFNHHEKRDSMVVLFANRLPAGVYEYTYVARATTIGKFIIPPTRAEEMYAPEVFGRTATMFGEVVK